jgi:hypothetical protein
VDNTATVTGSDGQTDQASASTTYTCEAGFVDLLKLTQGVVNPSMAWEFKLFEGPDGFGGTQVGSTGSTLGDADGVLDFGGPALRPDETYTVCEIGVPAGYTSFWQVGSNTVIPYNPNADDDPPEDLGNRCVDFGAGTTIPVTVGTTIHFSVDNTMPGGDPRTPGYWKNWNTCTGGGQQFTADANGGWEEGFWLLEDVLDPNIGGGIVWDDILSDDLLFSIVDCEDAVNILDMRTLDGKKVASDPLHNLATHLLAAQLNFGAGACTTQEVAGLRPWKPRRCWTITTSTVTGTTVWTGGAPTSPWPANWLPISTTTTTGCTADPLWNERRNIHPLTKGPGFGRAPSHMRTKGRDPW